MRVDFQFNHPNPNKGWKIIHSIRVIPAGQEISDGAMRKYFHLDPNSRDEEIQKRVRRLRRPSVSHRLIVQYLDEDGDDQYIIIPTTIIGDGTKPVLSPAQVHQGHKKMMARRLLHQIRTGRLR